MRFFWKGNIMLQCNIYMHCLSTKLFSSYDAHEENKQIMMIYVGKFTVSIESSDYSHVLKI